MKKAFFLFLFFCSLTSLEAQKNRPAIQKVHPTNWWVGMQNPALQLLIYGPNAGTFSYSINYPGVRLLSATTVENPNYVFLDLLIDPATKPGTLQIVGKKGKQTLTQSYEIKARTSEPKGSGLASSDFVYLIMPDRFANGNPANDAFADMADTKADASDPILRHGGDIEGIINHLDYLQELGVTTLWLTPVIENDEKLKEERPNSWQAGYHGYHFTDHYKIDRRFGGAEAYKKLSDVLHSRGMKLVQDAVYNHVSDDHWMYLDPPTKDWFHNWNTYTNTNHREQPMLDPHRSAVDSVLLMDGWFTPFLPDLNQRNPFLANYLIQHAIWSTETFNLDAWRIDTYKYNDQPFMNRCNAALMTEYPNILLFGETFVADPLDLSYFVQNNVAFPFKSNLPGTLDFPLNYAILNALNQKFSWDEGISHLYKTLSKDILYANPMNMVTSLDNHDMDRYFSVIGEDFEKYKMGVTWLLTTRGIPSLYYGTEILMKNFKNPTDAEVRRNFPGGFTGDSANAFTQAGRSGKVAEAFDYVKALARYRKATPALHGGKLMQYVPQDGMYVYFRYNQDKTVMIATNTMDTVQSLPTSRFVERMSGFKNAKNVLTGETINDLSVIRLPAKTALVLELMK